MDIDFLVRKYCEHLKYIRGLSPATVRVYRVVILLFAKSANVARIEEVTESSLREFFLNGRVQQNWRAYTYIHYYQALNVFFQWCISTRYMAANPLSSIEMPKPEKRLPASLNREKAMKLLEVVFNYPYDYTFLRYRNHAIFCMLVFAGLRRKELINLRLTDIDFDGMSIFVNQGKGSKDRIIPMSFTLAESLKRYLSERKRLNKTCPQFFVSLNRDCGFTYTGLRNLIYIIRKASGIKFSSHILRHTFATLMLEGGCDIFSLSKMMGHTDIKTTTIYLSTSAEFLRSQVIKHPLNDLVRFV
ncbi:MAG: tyrosine-type recombinase/integrase [Bacteroidetes bacterium]|nr:tyrosine-type recombinase/integrase [Bacteroidota bacterium]